MKSYPMDNVGVSHSSGTSGFGKIVVDTKYGQGSILLSTRVMRDLGLRRLINAPLEAFWTDLSAFKGMEVRFIKN